MGLQLRSPGILHVWRDQLLLITFTLFTCMYCEGKDYCSISASVVKSVKYAALDSSSGDPTY